MTGEGSDTLDCRGELCPVPIIKLGQWAKLHPGRTIVFVADDPAVVHDVQAWSQMTGGQVEAHEDADAYTFTIRLPD